MGGGVFIGGGGRGEGAGTPKPAATPVAHAKAGGRERGFIDNKKVTEGMRRLDRDAGMTANSGLWKSNWDRLSTSALCLMLPWALAPWQLYVWF